MSIYPITLRWNNQDNTKQSMSTTIILEAIKINEQVKIGHSNWEVLKIYLIFVKMKRRIRRTSKNQAQTK